METNQPESNQEKSVFDQGQTDGMTYSERVRHFTLINSLGYTCRQDLVAPTGVPFNDVPTGIHGHTGSSEQDCTRSYLQVAATQPSGWSKWHMGNKVSKIKEK